jgi:hypothetical protein
MSVWGVIRDRSSRSCMPSDVRFDPKATCLLSAREMTRRAMELSAEPPQSQKSPKAMVRIVSGAPTLK